MMESKGAIFDVDGTLLDSMPVWHNIGELYLESLGITCEKDLGDKIYAMSLEQGASYLRKEYHLEKSESEIIHEVLKIVDDFYRLEAPLKPGVRKVLDWFNGSCYIWKQSTCAGSSGENRGCRVFSDSAYMFGDWCRKG